MIYKFRIPLFMLLDAFFVISSIYASYWLFTPNTFTFRSPHMMFYCVILLISYLSLSYFFNMYKKIWEYASVAELQGMVTVSFFAFFLTEGAHFLLNDGVFFARILMVASVFLLLCSSGSRFWLRSFRQQFVQSSINRKRTLIIGAGSAGAMIARQLLQNANQQLHPVAFVDDNVKKQQLEMYGIPIIGEINDIQSIVKDYEIEHILIAIPSLSPKELNHIYHQCTPTTAKIQMMPMLEDILEGKVSISSFHDVGVEDLLGREQVELDKEGIAEKVTAKTILVTGAGAGGSIGSEICRQLAAFKPAKIILHGHGENSIYTIEMELAEKYGEEMALTTEIADIQDRQRMISVMKKHEPDVVYHAAAHKHVPLMERNPEEAVKNNIIGTKNVAEAAHLANVDTFVMISTDKAVNPTSVMGATKRIAEMIIQQMNETSETTFVAVRFGNVLGSRGSVIPRFKEQIKTGGPVTVTHPEMTRYFMTIPEASRLVIQASVLAKGGEIFVLDMGKPVKIVDLATNLILLSGHTVEEIGITFTGMRPGEKMYEELLGEKERATNAIFPKIYIGKSIGDNKEIFILCEKLKLIEDRYVLRKMLLKEATDSLNKLGDENEETI